MDVHILFQIKMILLEPSNAIRNSQTMEAKQIGNYDIMRVYSSPTMFTCNQVFTHWHKDVKVHRYWLCWSIDVLRVDLVRRGVISYYTIDLNFQIQHAFIITTSQCRCYYGAYVSVNKVFTVGRASGQWRCLRVRGRGAIGAFSFAQRRRVSGNGNVLQ